jgi:hypothetical protein
LKNMIRQAAQNLLETARRESATETAIKAAAESLFNSVLQSSRDEVHEAMRALAGAFQLPDAKRAGLVALVCGSLVEGGYDPETIAAPLVERLGLIVEGSERLAQACLERMPKPPEKTEDRDGGQEEDEEPLRAFEEAKRELAGRMPEEAAAWEALEQLWRPAIAVFSTSSRWRATARGLRQPAARIAEYHEAGHWLQLMLAVLDDEPILVIEPERRLGMLGRMSGVVDNFQLHVLLMDVFPKSGIFRRRRVPARVAEIARGKGPQQTDDVVTGKWNLYTWKAVRPDLSLPAPDGFGGSDNWIWGEGVPDDIPVFEGHRVILLGPPSYVRTWRSQRMFSRLRASVEPTRTLRGDEATEWLRRMTSAARPD